MAAEPLKPPLILHVLLRLPPSPFPHGTHSDLREWATVPAWYEWSLESHAQLLTKVILINVKTVEDIQSAENVLILWSKRTSR